MYEACDEWVEVGFANASFAEHPLHGRANLGADLVAMRFRPVDFEIALDRLDERTRLYLVKLRQVNAEHDLLSADQKNPAGATTTQVPASGPPIVSKAADIFKPVGLTMAIRPTITNENTVYLKINFTKALPKADGGEDSSTTNTELYVRSGLTAVLSSSYATILTDLDTGVPGLRDIPVLGGLFNNNQKKDNTSDTMLFVTPTILKPL